MLNIWQIFIFAWGVLSPPSFYGCNAELLTPQSIQNDIRKYIHSPSTRTVVPETVYRTTGNVSLVDSLRGHRQTGDHALFYTLTGPEASITYDFGQMTAGLPSVEFGSSTCTGCNTSLLPSFSCGSLCNGLGVAYTESHRFVGPTSDNSTLYSHEDGTLYVPVMAGQAYTLPPAYARGGFRYLTFSLPPQADALQSVQFRLIHIIFQAQQSLGQPSAYAGYFFSSDHMLNRIWYAAAYTLQLATVAANSSVQHLALLSPQGWSQDAIATNFSGVEEFLSDGAKRDRNPWAGDLGVAIRSAVSLNADLVSIKNSLLAMLILQDPVTGYFPYCGSPLGNVFSRLRSLYNSDTYHLWTIVSFSEYVLASGDEPFATQHWDAVSRGLNVVISNISTTSGLFNGSGTDDWGRVGAGGENTALNALLYYSLIITSRASTFLDKPASMAENWTTTAERVKLGLNAHLYDASRGLFWDNTTAAGHAIYPQDGNVLAVHFNATTLPAQSLTIMHNLAKRHSKFGPLVPELPGAISPFISSLELFAHFEASPADAGRALSLIRQQWGYMMRTFSNSTFIEGYGSDGDLSYPFYPGGAGFISHAHAWSTGPLYTLSARVAGLRASVFDVAPENGEWVFQPAVHGSGLSFASAGFTRSNGNFTVLWTLSPHRFQVEITVPSDSIGTIYVPTSMGHGEMTLDGRIVTASLSSRRASFVRVARVSGGRHDLSVSL